MTTGSRSAKGSLLRRAPQRSGTDRLKAVVAIPAKDEADRLSACLEALSNQKCQGQPFDGIRFGIVVLANNCRDATAEIARQAALHFPGELRVVETRLPAQWSHAGGARRAAMDAAAAWLAEDGEPDSIILTTDADSRAAPDWLSANLRAFAEGAEVVLGRISLDEDGARLPPQLHARGKFESVYEDLLTEMAARLDPQPFNPWPHHATISGATLAVRHELYLQSGGMPRVPLGEDKAFIATLRRIDARIRFASDVHVVTSGRTVGRAPGGVADTLRLRSDDPGALCDESLEPCGVAFRRALWRGRLRRDGFVAHTRWQKALKIPRKTANRLETLPSFGEVWDAIESKSPRLTRLRLAPGELPEQIKRASALLRRLQARSTPDEGIESIVGLRTVLDDVGERAGTGDEKLGGLVAS